MTPYTPSSTGATQGSQPSPIPSLYPSSQSTHDGIEVQPRSPSPIDREVKRRRLRMDTSHAEQHDPENMMDGSAASSPHNTSQSLPDHSSRLGHIFGGQEAFFGRSRELLNIVMSSHTVQTAVPRVTRVLKDLPLPGVHHIIDYLPVISADSSHFMGWREKTDTWPTGGIRYMNRSYTR